MSIHHKRIIFLCFYILVNLHLFATVDSLKYAFAKQQGTEKIETGLKLAYKLTSKPAVMLDFSLQLLELANKTTNDKILISKTNRLVADAYYYTDSIEQSTVYLHYAIRAIENTEVSNSFLLGCLYSDIGLNYQQTNNPTEALPYLKKAIKILDENNHAKELADAKSNLATYYYKRGDFENAIDLFVDVYRFDKQADDKKSQANSLNNLARIYVDWGKYETALDYYIRSAALLDSLGDKRSLGVRYNNIGMIYQTTGNHLEAIDWFTLAYNIEKHYGQTSKLAIRLCNLGISYSHLGKYDLAEENLKKGLNIFLENENNSNISKTYSTLAELYSNMNKMHLVEPCLNKAIQYAQKNNSMYELSIAYQQMWQYYKQQNNFSVALHYHELYSQTEKDLYSLEANKTIEELNAKYQSQQKDTEINKLEAVNKLNQTKIAFKNKQRNAAFIATTILLLVLILLTCLFYILKTQKSKLSKQNAELENLNQSLNRLFAIISHDLRNATASYQNSTRIICHYLEKGTPEKLIPLSTEIKNNAHNLSSMLENLLLWAASQLNGVAINIETISLLNHTNTVVDILKNEIEQKDNRIEIDIDYSINVLCDAESLNLILRNLIGNANKFTTKGIIRINAKKNINKILLTISDTGIGIQPEKIKQLFVFNGEKPTHGTAREKGIGLGLALVAEHVNKNNGQITVQSTLNKGTCFEIELLTPKNDQNEKY